jgi:hypothetical protein
VHARGTHELRKAVVNLIAEKLAFVFEGKIGGARALQRGVAGIPTAGPCFSPSQHDSGYYQNRDS